MFRIFAMLITIGFLQFFLSGCQTVTAQKRDRVVLDASQEGEIEGTGTSSADIRSMAERMAREVAGIQWPPGTKNPRIALTSIDNQTRFPFNPNLIKDRLLADLIEFSMPLGVRYTEDPNGADYIMSARITALSKGSRDGVNDYLLYSFKMIDKANTVVWMKTYETKKQGTTGVMYR